MKKFSALILCLLMLASVLAACQPAYISPGESTAETEEESKVQIVQLDISKYKIIRAEQMTTSLINEISQMKKELDGLTGKQIGISDDWLRRDEQPDDNAYEILIGSTNRSQTAEAMSRIEGAAFTVAIIGNKIIIAGTTDTATSDALAYFLNTYVRTSDKGMMSIPQDLAYISEPYRIVELVAGGSCSYTIVYNDSLDNTAGSSDNDRLDYEVLLAKNIRDMIKTLTGADAALSTDWKKAGDDVSDKHEILIGSTNRPETAEALAKVGAAEYCVEIIGNKIVVAGWNELTTKLAADEFEAILKRSIKKDDDGTKSIVFLENEYTKKANTEWITDIPEYEGGVFAGSFDCNFGELQYYYTETSITQYSAYLTKLEQAGYSLYFENSMGGNAFSTYTNSTTFIHTYYVAYQNAVRIITGSTKGTVKLPDVAGQDYKKITDSSITQMTLDYESGNFGMCYVITLEDGSFIIYDGGGDKGGKDHIRLYNLLKQINKRPDGEIVIAAWVITHEHWDHFIGFFNFCKAFGGRVTIEQFISNTPTKIVGYNSDNPNTYIEDGKFKDASASAGGIKFVKPHTGQVIKVRNASIEVLFTQEDIYPNRLYFFNDSTMITRVNIAGQSIMFLGDTDAVASGIICNMLGSNLKSDIVQVAHHGYRGATLEFYKLISPGFAFWPTSEGEFKKQTGGASQPYNVVDSYVANKIGLKDIAVASPDNIMIMLPYIFGSEALIRFDVPTN